MTNPTDNIQAPSLLLFTLESGRATVELGAFFVARPFFKKLPRGDGHPVLVLPGFGAGDFSTLPLRGSLKQLGYAAYGWEQGINTGMTPQIKQQLTNKLQQLHQKHGKKVSLIGWSLGGVFAREMARKHTEQIRLVITLASPFTGNPRANNFYRIFNLLNPKNKDTKNGDNFSRRSVPPPVPATSIVSRTDGIIAWQCSLEKKTYSTENVEIPSSHLGIGHNPLSLYIIADRLAQPEAAWKPFHTSGFLTHFYKDPQR